METTNEESNCDLLQDPQEVSKTSRRCLAFDRKSFVVRFLSLQRDDGRLVLRHPGIESSMQPAGGDLDHSTSLSNLRRRSQAESSTMPPLTATTKPLEPIALTPSSCVSAHSPHDSWLEKVYGPRVKPLRPHKDSLVRRNLGANQCKPSDDNDEHSYREELQKYIAESTANLSVGVEPLDDSDDSSDELLSPCSDIFDCDLNSEDEYVEAPVEVSRNYRTQDLQGGMLVGGHCVLFTNWAFKRQLQRRRRLPPIPERRYSGEYERDEEDEAAGVYSGKIVEL